MKLRSALLMTLAIGGTGLAHAADPVTTTPALFNCPSEPEKYISILDFPSRVTRAGDEETIGKPPKEIGKPPYTIKIEDGYSAVKVTEIARKTRLEEDFEKVAGGFGRLEGEPEKPTNQCFSFDPKLKRASVTIEYTGDGEPAKSRKIVTGPEEHVYLSADMPVTNIKQLTYDSSTNSVVEKEKPSTFYVGVNYKIGDLASDDPDAYFTWSRVSGKFLAQASKRPNESMGLGVSYDIGAIDLFVAYLWTKDDEAAYGKKPGTTGSTVFGVSFNIDKGVKWLKD